MSTQSQEPQAKALQQPSVKEEAAKSVAPPGPASTPRGGGTGPQRTKKLKKWLIAAAVVLLGASAGFFAWWKLTRTDLPEGFAQSNGRIEATEVDVATKLAGRILDELVDEGDYVTAGQVVAHMDIDVLTAQLREAEANLLRGKSRRRDCPEQRGAAQERERGSGVRGGTARSRTRPRRKEARPCRRPGWKRRRLGRGSRYPARRHSHSAKAAVSTAKANVAAADAAITTAKSPGHRGGSVCRCSPGKDRTASMRTSMTVP